MHDGVATREEGTRIDPEWLKAAQAAAGDVKSAALARRLEVDNTTVYRWRSGDNPITKLTWIAILGALGLPLDWQPSTTKRATKRSH